MNPFDLVSPTASGSAAKRSFVIFAMISRRQTSDFLLQVTSALCLHSALGRFACSRDVESTFRAVVTLGNNRTKLPDAVLPSYRSPSSNDAANP